MICDMCKDKVATIHLKEIIDDDVTHLHLCQDCYDAREEQSIKGAIPETEMLLESASTGSGRKGRPKVCGACGTTEEYVRTKGRLGCGECYGVFSATVEPILKRVHGSVEHRGKIPRQSTRNLDLKKELMRLQEDLQRAIDSEEYEQAARLRDRIKQYESS